VHQVGFSLHHYIEMHGRQKKKIAVMLRWKPDISKDPTKEDMTISCYDSVLSSINLRKCSSLKYRNL